MADSETNEEYKTESGIPLKKAYRPDDVVGLDYERDLGEPGGPPYTRGPYPDMYRSRLWRISQLMGSGRPEDTSNRVKFSHEIGGDWIVFELDQIINLHMWDPDHPEVLERKDDVGLTGSPVIGLPDWEILLDGIAFEKKYFHMGGTPWSNSSSAILIGSLISFVSIFIIGVAPLAI